MKRSVLGLALLVCALGAVTASAQDAPATVTLHLNDGSVVVGRIVSEEGGRVRIATEGLGEVTIEVARIVDRGAVA